MSFITNKLAPKNKYHQDEAKLDTTNYGGTIGQAAGNAQQVYGQQQGVNQALENTANGTGPNPAAEMLRQQTGQNVNMAAGQAASARGVNPAMAMRQSVDTGASLNQGAAGQAATMQAQQSLAARQAQMQNLAGMGQQQGQLFGTAGQLQNQQNQANIANVLGAGQINAGVAAQNTQMSSNMLGGLLNGAGGAAGMMMGGPAGAAAAQAVTKAAHGGEIPHFADGGGVGPFPEYGPPAEPTPPLHSYMDNLAAMHAPPNPLSPGPLQMGSMDAPVAQAPPSASPAGVGGAAMRGIGDGLSKDSTGAFDRFAHMRTPGLTMAQGGDVPLDFTEGGGVPGEPIVDQDNEVNDVVPAMVSPEEIVLPLSITKSPNAPEEAARFVEHLLRSKGQAGGYDRVLQARGQSYAEGGPVLQDPEHFQRRVLPEDQPLSASKRDIPVPDVDPGFYMGDAMEARRKVDSKKPVQKLKDGGEVQKGEEGLGSSVAGWWAARGTPAEDAARQQVVESANAVLPSWVSGRAAVLKKRGQMKQVDDVSKE
jgi:hypothetical protein